jgi:hypothetical protein
MFGRAGLVSLILISSFTEAATFGSVGLSDDASVLTVRMTDGTVLSPRPETDRFDKEQSEFVAPKISEDGKFVGWLAAYPGLGASYAMTAELVMMDLRRRLHHFHGDWALVGAWCFPNEPGEVVLAVSFSHGLTEHDVQLRRIDDDKLLARYRIPSGGQERAHALSNAPDWFTCIRAAVSRR